MKIISFYLPQFHRIPENDMWWGKNFTEWTNVKKAKPLFENHYQPRIPLNNNYYDLSDIEVMRKQAMLAHGYGVYGFCFYHYWFDGKLLLEKPIENYLQEKTINFPFCLCWANEDWTNQWVSNSNKVLMKQTYGNRNDWKKHYEYLKYYFKDSRYIRINGKPLFIIYRPDLIPKINEFIKAFREFAKEDGIGDLCIACQRPDFFLDGSISDLSSFDYCIEYQPIFAFGQIHKKQSFLKLRKIKRIMYLEIEKRMHISLGKIGKKKVEKISYDELWRSIIESDPLMENSLPGAFVDWDNTPRKGTRGSVVIGGDPVKFEFYMKKQIEHAQNVYHSDFLFLFAWNEWGEGGYLEPDERNGLAYLEVLKKMLC